MQVAHFETFLRVVAEGSFTRAALSLDVMQSTVSARIAALEEEVGDALFARNGNHVELSAAGRALVPHAEQITQLVYRAKDSVRAATREALVSQTVRIGANGASSMALVPGIIRRLRTARPDLAVVVEVDRTRGLMPLLMEGIVSMAFVNPQLTHRATEVLWSYTCPCVLLAPPGHRLADAPCRVEDLRSETLVASTIGPALAALHDVRALIGEGLTVSVESSSGQVIQALIAAGEGVGFLPQALVAEDLRDGKLVQLQLVDYEPRPWEVVLVRWRERVMTGAEAAFVGIVRHGAATINGIDGWHP